MQKRILFYYPSNKRSNVLETTFKEIKDAGNEVIFLSSCEKGALHEKLEEFGIQSYTSIVQSKSSIGYYIKQIRSLIRFCKKHQIDVVFSHLQHVNFIAVFAQYFISAQVIIFRHHFKFHKGNFNIPLKTNKNEVFFDKVINRLARQMVVPSSGVYNGMVNFEKVDKKKLQIIPYLYDFSQYKEPDSTNVNQLKETYPAKLRLIMIARLIPFKRHALIFPIIKKLLDEGLDLQLLVLDEGPEKERLQAYVDQHQLNERIHLLGFQTHIIDYMAAADLIIHPSLTEASNNTIKEIGLLAKAVAVCRGVGDFNDYLIDGENGFFMDTAEPQADAETIIRKVYDEPQLISQVGSKLKESIKKQFGDYEAIKKQHLDLLN